MNDTVIRVVTSAFLILKNSPKTNPSSCKCSEFYFFFFPIFFSPVLTYLYTYWLTSRSTPFLLLFLMLCEKIHSLFALLLKKMCLMKSVQQLLNLMMYISQTLHRNRVQKDNYIIASGTNSSCRIFLRNVLECLFQVLSKV